LKRAAYLCELNGVDIAAESNTSMPAAFLMQQMEWRESLEELRSGTNQTGLQLLEQEVQSSLKLTIRNIQSACEMNDFHAVAT
jgi:molecular chaperone HscB